MKYSDWDIINTLFRDNPDILVKHHLDSFNSFFFKGIPNIIQYYNPVIVVDSGSMIDSTTYSSEIHLYLGGKQAKDIYYGKPIIHEEDGEQHYMYPNEARLKNMTYASSIHYDIEVDVINRTIVDGVIKQNVESFTLNKVYFCKIPIMLQSKLCILNEMSKEARYQFGECKNDPGGYFIVDGKEKVIVNQEKFGDNLLYLRKASAKDENYSYYADMRTVSEDPSKPKRTLSVALVKSNNLKTTSNTENEEEKIEDEGVLSKNNIVVFVPNVRKPVPLFILMRALGIESDKEIIEMCLLDLHADENLIDFFIPSIYDAGSIFTQKEAIAYIKLLIKHKTKEAVLEILLDYLLPNISGNFLNKAYVIGYMVKRLIYVATSRELPTDRDSFRYKRIETTGMLLHELFQEYYRLHVKSIKTVIDVYSSNKDNTFDDVIKLIKANYNDIFIIKTVEKGIMKGFKGNWGSLAYTKKDGVVQDLNRLSFLSSIAHLRKLNLSMDSSAKLVKPRLLHSSHYGIVCPVHTPDGGNVGFHKHLSIGAHITAGTSSSAFMKYLLKHNVRELHNLTPHDMKKTQKVFLNGNWIGIHVNPVNLVNSFKNDRRNGYISVFTNIYWDIQRSEIYFATDSGRLCRPVLYITRDENATRVSNDINIENDQLSWKQLVDNLIGDDTTGTLEYDYVEKIGDESTKHAKSVIEYMDTLETEGSYIAMYEKDIDNYHTHLEIHPSLMLSVLGNMIIFPENNQLPRDLFSCGQSKQAVSLYHSNFLNRIDTLGVVLNYGQNPIVKSRYLDYVCNSQHPYGENVIVAIACYSGYNVEDALIFNQASVDRGLFRTTYYKLYEDRESSDTVAESDLNTKFLNVLDNEVTNIKADYDYNNLNADGVIKENTQLNEKMILVGKAVETKTGEYVDKSMKTKKGQQGFVDKSFITDAEDGFRIAKIRVREERTPAIGDKLCSRAGQKGTIGIILPEEDMPFTEDGIRPDVIMNPHAIPSRMTIGHLVECIIGKVCVMKGYYGDCTAFEQKESKLEEFGNALKQCGFHSSGNQILTSGFTGEQLESSIFFGPNYYLRLKHMVKDKINYRNTGPRSSMTRQTVQGRSNDGGLRIGEMERDGLIAHGMTSFVQDSMMKRGDAYSLAICNHTGNIAVYNEHENIMYSLHADGPLCFDYLHDPDLDTRARHISRFGKSFSVVHIPYSMKLLMQELVSMNVSMQIITDANVNHLMDMEKNKKYGKKLKSYEAIYKELSKKNASTETKSNTKTNTDKLPRRSLAIIVPYFLENKTINIPNQNRKEHLIRFKTHMKSFIEKAQEYAKREKRIHLNMDLMIIEQNYNLNELQKINRGALLNTGYFIAKNRSVYDAYMFHDIDLLPADSMVIRYVESLLLVKDYKFVHLSNISKYAQIGNRHIGGVLVVDNMIFENVNGYPNYFEGWGGEDEAFLKRVERYLSAQDKEADLDKLIFRYPLEESAFDDLEKNSLQEKYQMVQSLQIKNEHIKDSHELDIKLYNSNGYINAEEEKLYKVVDETQEYYPTIYTYLVDFIPQHTSYNIVSNPIENNDELETMTELPQTKNTYEAEGKYDSESDVNEDAKIINYIDNQSDNDFENVDDENKNENIIDKKEIFVNTEDSDETISPLKILENVTLSAKDISNSLAEKLPNIINTQQSNVNENVDTNENESEDESNSKTVTTEINN